MKVFSQFHITAELADYAVPIDVTARAAAIQVAPALTTVTYSHAAFTVRQRMFAARHGAGMGATAVFEIESARPLDLTFQFRPDMVRMWPAPSFGVPNAEWVHGCYLLHTDDPTLAATVAMARAKPGILAPYQERPKTYPVEFRLHFDPKRDAGLAFPLVAAMGTHNADEMAAAIRSVPNRFAETEDYYRHFFDSRLTAETPDKAFDRASLGSSAATRCGPRTRRTATATSP